MPRHNDLGCILSPTGAGPEPDYAAPELEQNTEPAQDSGTKLDIPAGGGGISIAYSSAVTVSLSKGEVQFQYTHPSSSTQNIVLCVEVEGTVIAQSGLILPGSQLQTLPLLEGAADTFRRALIQTPISAS